VVLNARMPHRSQQNGIVPGKLVEKIRRRHAVMGEVIIGAPRILCPREGSMTAINRRLDRADRLAGDFRSNPVPRDDGDVKGSRHVDFPIRIDEESPPALPVGFIKKDVRDGKRQPASGVSRFDCQTAQVSPTTQTRIAVQYSGSVGLGVTFTPTDFSLLIMLVS
jgi:hypothetical protein